MKNILQLYKIMLHYWGYLLAGFIFMFGFAFLSGLSLTMVIPLFDYVFSPRTTQPIVHKFSELLDMLGKTYAQFFSGTNSVFDLGDEVLRTPFVAALKDLMAKTDPWLLLLTVCGTFFLLVFIKNILFFANKITFANLRGKTIYQIRNVIFRKYLQQSLKFFNVNQAGDSIVRMIDDVNNVSNMYIDGVFNLLRDFLLLLVYAGIAISLNTKFFFLSLVVLPVFSFLVTLLGKKIKKYAIRIQLKFSDMFSVIEEVLNNMRIVKAFAREDYELDKFKKISWQHFRFWRKSMIYASFNTPLGEIHGTLTAILVILIGGKLVLNPTSGFTSGEFLTFLFAIFSMLHPMKTLTVAYGDIKKAQVSVDRIFYILAQETEIKSAANPVHKNSFEQNIVLQNVQFHYNENSHVLKNVNLEIKKGERIAFVGSSGAGKTTLINLLPRMYDINSGAITIDGVNINQIELTDLRKLFGTVTQDSILFSDTIANNIRYGSLAEVTDDAVIEAAQIAYADEFINKLPKKYDEMLHAKGANFSGGQKQRLCIARAIVSNPPILIFDEATSSLDTEAEQKVQRAIERATQNRTVLVIAHRLSTVLSADKIVVLDKGEIVGIGKHKELLRTCPRYKKLYQLQFDKPKVNQRE